MVFVSLKQRLQSFHLQVVTKNLEPAKQLTYASQYRRLQLTRRSLETLVCGLLVFGGQQFLIQNDFFLPLWPATGVALAAIFLRGNFLLVGIFLGIFASYLCNQFPFLPSLFFSSLFTSHIFLIRSVALTFIGAIAPLNNKQDWWDLLLIILSVCLLYLLLLKYGLSWMAINFSLQQTRFAILGEINGIVCLLPLCLAFDPFVPQRYFRSGLYPQQMIFTLKGTCRVGAERSSHRSVYKIHDCGENREGNNPENSSVKGIEGWKISSLLLIGLQLLYFVLPESYCIILSIVMFGVMMIYSQIFGLIPTSLTWFGISILYIGGAIAPFHLFQYSFSTQTVFILCLLFTLTTCLSLSRAIAP